MKLSELAKDSWATSILALVPFGALFWVREEYGRAAFTDLFAAIAAYAALWFVIWAIRGGDQATSDRSLEGPREGPWIQCSCGWKRLVDQSGEMFCPECGAELNWVLGRVVLPSAQVQSEEGDE